MIIRRRTYIRQFTGRYGYFMRDSTVAVHVYREQAQYINGEYQYVAFPIIQGQTNKIYTKCMQKETPVGEFPISYREDDAVVYGIDNYGPRTTTAAMGCTNSNSTEIIVFTMKRLFRSTNEGISWTQLATLPSHDAYNIEFNPIAYVDDNYYYFIYSVRQSATAYGNTYNYLYLYKYNKSTNSGSETLIRSDYVNKYVKTFVDNNGQTNTSTYTDTIHTNLQSTFYNSRVSSKGQILFELKRIGYDDSGQDDYSRQYIVFDFPNGKYSGVILGTSIASNWSSWVEHCGQWINDGANNDYGSFYIEWLYSISTTYRAKVSTSAITYNGKSLSLTLLSAPNIDPMGHQEGTNEYVSYYGTCKQRPNIRLLVFATQSSGEGTFYSCNPDLTDYTKICDWNSEMSSFFGSSFTWPCGLCVTPDGKYGVFLCERGNLVFDMTTNQYFGGFNMNDLPEEEIPTAYIRASYGSYMLPETTLSS